MTDYDRTNSGALFKNDKQGNEKRPDYNGSLNVNGQDFWISAWLKVGKSGKFMSLSVKPKDEKPAQRQAPPSRSAPPSRGGFDDLDESIPF